MTRERTASGDQFVGDHRQRILVRPLVLILTAPLFRRHIGGGSAEPGAMRRRTFPPCIAAARRGLRPLGTRFGRLLGMIPGEFLQTERQTEIDQRGAHKFAGLGPRNGNVLRLDIPVNHAVFVRVIERVANIGENRQNRLHRKPFARGDIIVEHFRHPLHDEKITDARILGQCVKRTDILMVQRMHRLEVRLDQPHDLFVVSDVGRDHLDGDRPLAHVVVRFPNLPHLSASGQMNGQILTAEKHPRLNEIFVPPSSKPRLGRLG